jgi:hypothetical protein
MGHPTFVLRTRVQDLWARGDSVLRCRLEVPPSRTEREKGGATSYGELHGQTRAFPRLPSASFSDRCFSVVPTGLGSSLRLLSQR